MTFVIERGTHNDRFRNREVRNTKLNNCTNIVILIRTPRNQKPLPIWPTTYPFGARSTMSFYEDEPPAIDIDDMIEDAEDFDESKYTASCLKKSCLTCGFVCT